MSILNVRLYTDPILHKSCELVSNFNKLDVLAADMIETMLHYKGIGLAAPQVGINQQIAVCWMNDKTDKITLINPKILCYTKETDTLEEGCLSAPGVFLPVVRYKGVEVGANDLTGNLIRYRFTDFDARIFMHEYSHLQGKLVTDFIFKL